MFLLLTAWTCVLCFYHLGEAGTQNWDEAIYGINAYEMIQSGNWWIQTYRYAVDYYNLKPPFIMWCIALCFQSLGFSFFAMRLPSRAACAVTSVTRFYDALAEFAACSIARAVCVAFTK